MKAIVGWVFALIHYRPWPRRVPLSVISSKLLFAVGLKRQSTWLTGRRGARCRQRRPVFRSCTILPLFSPLRVPLLNYSPAHKTIIYLLGPLKSLLTTVDEISLCYVCHIRCTTDEKFRWYGCVTLAVPWARYLSSFNGMQQWQSRYWDFSSDCKNDIFATRGVTSMVAETFVRSHCRSDNPIVSSMILYNWHCCDKISPVWYNRSKIFRLVQKWPQTW